MKQTLRAVSLLSCTFIKQGKGQTEGTGQTECTGHAEGTGQAEGTRQAEGARQAEGMGQAEGTGQTEGVGLTKGTRQAEDKATNKATTKLVDFSVWKVTAYSFLTVSATIAMFSEYNPLVHMVSKIHYTSCFLSDR